MDCRCKKIIICKILIIIMVILLIVVPFLIIICCQNNFKQPDILTSIAVNGDNTQLGTTFIKFSKNEIEEGNTIIHEPGSYSFIVNQNGIYQISYQLYGLKNVVGTFNFNAVLVVNNIALENTFNESPIIRNSVNRMTLTATVILRLNEGDILQLSGVSIEDILYQRARIDIEKIG